MIVNAKQFSERTGFPLAMIRRMCRTGVIRHWRCGRMFLFDEDKAMKTLEMLQEQPHPYFQSAAYARFGCYKTLPKGGVIKSGTEELRQRLREKRKQQRKEHEGDQND